MFSPGALVLAHGDGRTFSLWYGTQVLAPRPDVTVVYDDLLDWPWYRAGVARHDRQLTVPADTLRGPLRRAVVIAAHLDRRPVYVTHLEPEIAHLFAVEPAGPLFRVTGPVPGAR